MKMRIVTKLAVLVHLTQLARAAVAHPSALCGAGTVWITQRGRCEATYDGVMRACKEHRGTKWAFTCGVIQTCDSGNEDNHGQDNHGQDNHDVSRFFCQYDDISKLVNESRGQVTSCEKHACAVDAFAALGAPHYWYQETCCKTCNFSPMVGSWGFDSQYTQDSAPSPIGHSNRKFHSERGYYEDTGLLLHLNQSS